MKTMSPLVMATTVLLFVNAALQGAEQLDRVISMTGGSSTLSYTITTRMKGTGVAASAIGKLQATLKRKGTAINEQLRIQLSGLTPNASYQLTAFTPRRRCRPWHGAGRPGLGARSARESGTSQDTPRWWRCETILRICNGRKSCRQQE